ncbi:MAG TPA: 16S rRNA (guanine(527)-N(7))-methyltransferase RsmG [Steroidobacteraceae bacterium]|nr:16S rRNA (guanine(527)-N(7))-methyltransferase RsmG [Steroidobacteraceae bacterium]
MDAAIGPRLTAGLAELGLDLAPAQVGALTALLAELADWNTRVNLTAIDDPLEAVDKHLLDSLAVKPHLKGLAIADVGSGAGFPGLPLAIADPDRRFCLIESTGKKARFLRHVVERLDLPNVEVLAVRAESYRPPAHFDSVIARALGTLSEFIRVAGHLAGNGGRLLAMKGKAPEAEIRALPKGWKVVAVHPVAVPGLAAERCLVELARV